MTHSARPLGASARLLLLLLAVLAGTAPSGFAQDEPPEASWLRKITWSAGEGLTRVRFHASWGIRPDVARTSATRLRVDLRGVGAGSTPSQLRVGSPEVERVQRIPESARGFLPPGVSERFLVVLAREDLAWNVESTEDGFVLLVGDEDLTGRPVPLPPAAPLAGILEAVEGPRDILPTTGQSLDQPVPFRVGEDLVRRAGPSALQPELGRVSRGEVQVADGRVGDWLHLRSGGWIRHALGTGASEGRGTDLKRRRTPMAWSVVTIVPVLNVQVEEMLPGRDPQADVIASYFRENVRIVRLTVLATGQSAFSFRFPPRADRLRLTLESGREQGSLDPMTLPRRAGVDLAQLEEAFPSPQISTGQGFSGWLVFPGDIDFLKVSEARIDIAGRIHRLFQVPGSGEMVRE